MILTCNSCNKKFVVPDNAITASGRMVQCGSCGNKWKQFPVSKSKRIKSVSFSQKTTSIPQQINKTPKKTKKKTAKKTREISLYSPEYLAQKHGIKITEAKDQKIINKNKSEKVSFGFYNSLILFIFLIIAVPRILYFSQDFIVSYFPAAEYYLNYFFESIRNIFEIWKSLISSY
tara:strand:+ start:59 stop:583 length:525 start_codon:yes stop_codon:yes gene_type:complete